MFKNISLSPALIKGTYIGVNVFIVFISVKCIGKLVSK